MNLNRKQLLEWAKEELLTRMADDGECQWVTIHGNPICIKHKVLSERDKIERTKIVNEIHEKYPTLSKDFISKEYDKAEKLRPKHEKLTHDYIKSFKEDFPDAEVSGRVKTTDSMLEKLGRKSDRYKNVNDLEDVSGVRIVAKDLDDVQKFREKIESDDRYRIVSSDDYINQPKDGYRSLHYTLEDRKTGLRSELQLRTKNQDEWANYIHDRFYKAPKDIRVKIQEKAETFKTYTAQLSDYYYQRDQGIKTIKRPDCQQEVMELIGCP